MEAPPAAKICFITAIYGGYEKTCKPYAKQTVPADFICFTDSKTLTPNGWTIDNTPYHLTDKSHLDNDTYINSLSNNTHTFNVAKYYKQAFQNIPILKKYDAIVWLDGSVEIIYDKTAEYILSRIYTHKIIGWHHEFRNGVLRNEAVGSGDSRYSSTFWNNQRQPRQDVMAQYNEYVRNGYSEDYFKSLGPCSPHLGVWITCFVAFFNKDSIVSEFLDFWYLQTLMHTTQDQVGFSYACQKKKLIPYTLPNNEISGQDPHVATQIYRKHGHNE
uniref:Nucleotide-diphospho-sugar transferase domain-containing protein n=1 Tax=viral metagenome TaxID=1070528 RepID=A0A6C0DRU9_9ZZZZ